MTATASVRRRQISFHRAVARAIALLPFAMAAVAAVAAVADLAAPRFFGGPPSELMGVPIDVLMQLGFLGWALIGAALLWDSRSVPRTAIGLVAFSAPSTAGILFAPAVILMLQNLGG